MGRHHKQVALFVVVAFVLLAEGTAQQQAPQAPQAVVEPPNNVNVGATVTSKVKCYQCNSHSVGQQDCEGSDLAQLAKYAKTCPRITDGSLKGKEATSCRKILQDVNDDEKGRAIVRECAYTGEVELDGKRRTGNKGITLRLYQCFNANNDKPCNGSATVKAISLLILPIVFFLFLL